MTARLELYIGAPEYDLIGNYICLDLVFSDGEEITLEEENVTGDFLESLEKVANTANLRAKDLSLPIHLQMDEFINACIEENLTEEDIRQVKMILRELRTKNSKTQKETN